MTQQSKAFIGDEVKYSFDEARLRLYETIDGAPNDDVFYLAALVVAYTLDCGFEQSCHADLLWDFCDVVRKEIAEQIAEREEEEKREAQLSALHLVNGVGGPQ